MLGSPQVWSDAPPLHTGGHKGQDRAERTPQPRLSTDRTNPRNDQAPCPRHTERGPLPIPPRLRPRRGPRDNCASEPPPTPRCVPSGAARRTALIRPVPAWPWGQVTCSAALPEEASPPPELRSQVSAGFCAGGGALAAAPPPLRVQTVLDVQPPHGPQVAGMTAKRCRFPQAGGDGPIPMTARTASSCPGPWPMGFPGARRLRGLVVFAAQ